MVLRGDEPLSTGSSPAPVFCDSDGTPFGPALKAKHFLLDPNQDSNPFHFIASRVFSRNFSKWFRHITVEKVFLCRCGAVISSFKLEKIYFPIAVDWVYRKQRSCKEYHTFCKKSTHQKTSNQIYPFENFGSLILLFDENFVVGASNFSSIPISRIIWIRTLFRPLGPPSWTSTTAPSGPSPGWCWRPGWPAALPTPASETQFASGGVGLCSRLRLKPDGLCEGFLSFTDTQ